MLMASSGTKRDMSKRRAFTMVELLVVLAIALVIVSLVAAGTMQVIAYQRTSDTEALIRMLMPPLNQQVKSVVDMAPKEPIPQSVSNIAAAGSPNDGRRARIIWTKLRVKQLLPMNFSEALAPWQLPSQYYSAPFVNPSCMLGPGDLPANPTYATVLSNAGITSGSPLPGAWPGESSPMLLLALQQAYNSSASKFAPDSLPPAALGSYPQQAGANYLLKQFIDAWQQPLVFYRWPAGNADVDASNPAGPSVAFRDPLDPEGLLQDPAWNNWTNYSGRAGVFWFEQYCHPVHTGTGEGIYTPKSFYLVPTIVSAGRNNNLGLAQRAMPGPPFSLAIQSPLLPDLMTADGSGADGDNINSFLLRAGARGD